MGAAISFRWRFRARLKEELARYKVSYVNRFIELNGIWTVIEFGCGDGQQLALLTRQIDRYLGLGVSATPVELCAGRFRDDPQKALLHYCHENRVRPERLLQAELTMSIDVIFHLVENQVYERYMQHLFQCSRRFVIVYPSNHEDNRGFAPHVRHRQFTSWIKSHCPLWTLVHHEKNPHVFDADKDTGSFCDFFAYAKQQHSSGSPGAERTAER